MLVFIVLQLSTSQSVTCFTETYWFMIQSCNLHVMSCLSVVLYHIEYTRSLVVHFKQTRHNINITGQDPILIIKQYKFKKKPTIKKTIVNRKAAIIS